MLDVSTERSPFPPAAEVIARSEDGPHGELVLRRVGEHFEIISNGTFLMDTRNGESERRHVRDAVKRVDKAVDVLIGGLGVGFSLVEALRHDRVRSVTVVERLRPIIDWHDGPLGEATRGAVTDRRVEVVRADVHRWLARPGPLFDCVCLDVDNGPDWTVVDENASLYTMDGLRAIRERLRPGGVLSVWSAGDSIGFRSRLSRCFGNTATLFVPVPRGRPDVVFMARRS